MDKHPPRDLRESLGISRKEFSRRYNLVYASCCNVEGQKFVMRETRYKYLHALNEAMGTNLSYDDIQWEVQ